MNNCSTNASNNVINNIEEINVKRKIKKQKIKNINNNTIKNSLLYDNNNLYNCMSSNNINIKINTSHNNIKLNHKKRITPFVENSYKKKNIIKNHKNTINNINNFNNCNYIYLLNNGDKYIKINRQFKA